jgi:hypothetical protein
MSIIFLLNIDRMKWIQQIIKNLSPRKKMGEERKQPNYFEFISTFHQTCELNTTAREEPDPILQEVTVRRPWLLMGLSHPWFLAPGSQAKCSLMLKGISFLPIQSDAHFHTQSRGDCSNEGYVAKECNYGSISMGPGRGKISSVLWPHFQRPFYTFFLARWGGGTSFYFRCLRKMSGYW